ncbi:MAG: nucleotide exchange factor GrpE [Chitinophagaceae bacterium]|jgi:molecular chaperone GrpE|nr:nucleotide exchange factor GrpE [Sphingobacteriales bacterium]OJW04834.1 MAG: nucleotide exchange factor GrpE [Sphingobacteriales bacterium 44-61]TXJ22644.1 MAG: nucleotide exchange factor GrpE [Chitinophagaceae bacterium]
MAEKDVKEQVNETPENNSGADVNTDENQATGESELEKLKAELEAGKDKYLRLVAEFDNFRRRSAKERIELAQTAGREVIQDLLEVLDDSDRAQKQLDSSDGKEVKEGVTLVFNKLRSLLQSKGLKPMEAIGKDFDPDLHEAITEIPAPTKELKGKVVDEVVKGYYLNDKIIRHAKVVVGK